MPVTIYDIARKLNLSAATVSRVLNGRGGTMVSQRTRDRVLSAAREMDYRPHALARALITGRSHNIAVYIATADQRADPHFARVLEGVEVRARALGYRTLVCSDLDDALYSRSIDGAVLLVDPADGRYAHKHAEVKCVYVANIAQQASGCVSWSDEEGAHLALDHLAGLGHHDVVVLLGRTGDHEGKTSLRVCGFREAMKSTHLACREVSGCEQDHTLDNGYALTLKMIDEGCDCTAILARNEFLALGALRALAESGLQVPRDVSVVSYGDTYLARCGCPPLTSVRAPITEAGIIAVEKIVEMAEGEMTEFAGAILPTSLIARESCAPPRRGPLARRRKPQRH